MDWRFGLLISQLVNRLLGKGEPSKTPHSYFPSLPKHANRMSKQAIVAVLDAWSLATAAKAAKK